jgi:hypothetical protein
MMYDREQQKEDGMSAWAVVECIENDTGVKLSSVRSKKKYTLEMLEHHHCDKDQRGIFLIIYIVTFALRTNHSW